MSSKIVNPFNLTLSKSERQKNLDEKKKKAEKLIQMHVAGSFAVGFTPIPFSDAPILLANQAALIERILGVYDMDGLKELVSMLMSQIGLGFIISRFAVKGAAYATAQLLKLIPCLGTIGGGLINGTIAAAITFAYGMSISSFCYRKIKAIIYTGADACVTDEDIKNFTHAFQEAFKSYPSTAKYN